MRFIKHLTTWLLLLTVITASGIVSAKVASGVQNLSGNLHQGNVTANALLRLAKIEFSYDAASGSPVATKGVLNPQQAKNLARFNKKKPANSTDTVIRDLPGGGKAFQADSAARNIPGSFARFEKQIDSAGKTTQFTKTTFGPKGEIVHVKDKITGQTFVPGQ